MTLHDELVEAMARAIDAKMCEAPDRLLEEGTDIYSEKEIAGFATAALSALRAKLAEKGMRVVPEVATDVMLKADVIEYSMPQAELSVVVDAATLAGVWSAMLAALSDPLEPAVKQRSIDG